MVVWSIGSPSVYTSTLITTTLKMDRLTVKICVKQLVQNAVAALPPPFDTGPFYDQQAWFQSQHVGKGLKFNIVKIYFFRVCWFGPLL